MREGWIRVAAETVIRRPVAEVFAYASDQRNEPTWDRDVLEISLASDSPRPAGPGSRWLVTVAFLGRGEYEAEVSDYEPDRLVRITALEGSFRPTATYRFEPVAGGTRFQREMLIPLHGPSLALEPLLAWVAARRNRRFVADLRERLEAPARVPVT